ncbi:hypothetical protein EF888_06915 [Silicimonas algicola]|uniref:Uncharacterized protein n=1 Tax=Silicimonas algicola TaxID=1826607 RepID=A0A316G3F8_9RHOB|nr:hypothetical protein [Silicimonas algicola]AZQ66893.1 hypothetical protein EF888_06915 [Silicimonas algicola]PWK55193.1 hypothetical protein C8D95_10872 [Silicimonas algicola]
MSKIPDDVLQSATVKHVYKVLQDSLRSLRSHMQMARTAPDPSSSLRVCMSDAQNCSKAVSKLAVALADVGTVDRKMVVPVPRANSKIAAALNHLEGSALSYAAGVIADQRIQRLARDLDAHEGVDTGDGHAVIGAEVLDRREWLSIRRRIGVLSDAEAVDLARLGGPILPPETPCCPECGLPAQPPKKRRRRTLS